MISKRSYCEGFIIDSVSGSLINSGKRFDIELINAVREGHQFRGVDCSVLTCDEAGNHICGAYRFTSGRPCLCPNAGNYNEFIHNSSRPLFFGAK